MAAESTKCQVIQRLLSGLKKLNECISVNHVDNQRILYFSALSGKSLVSVILDTKDKRTTNINIGLMEILSKIIFKL